MTLVRHGDFGVPVDLCTLTAVMVVHLENQVIPKHHMVRVIFVSAAFTPHPPVIVRR